ncbi:MAG: hypothetical protein GY835_12285 [bacterium]|nr:hypothetical protein [bacterium]
MSSRIKNLAIVIVLLAIVGFSCLPNPSGPTLDPPGDELLYFANYNSIQMCGDFQIDYDWSPGDARSNMSLYADNKWRISVAIMGSQTSDGQIEFKFAHDGSWNESSLGASGTPGVLEVKDNADNILLPLTVTDGFYIFEVNDETLRYTTNPAVEIGTITGSVIWDGAAPTLPASVECWVQHPAGDVQIWGAEAEGDAFTIPALADSLYRVRVNGGVGYSSATVDDVRVVDGVAVMEAVTLNQVFGAISGTVSFSDGPDPLPEALVVLSTHIDQVEVARFTTTTTSGDYLFEGLNYDDYDLTFTATGYQAGLIDSLHIDTDAVSSGNDIELAKIEAAIPDLPYLTPVIDGMIDVGWATVLDDPAGDSNWGGLNDFTGLHVAWDATNLYVAVAGSFDSGNTVNIYIDKDFDNGTGLADFSTIQSGSVADHLRKTIDMSGVTGFGADFAGSVWGTQYNPEVSDLTDSAAIVMMPGSALVGSSAAIEFSVPWTSLYPDMSGGIPGLTELAFICVIGGGDDVNLAGDTLPAVDDVHAPDAVFTIQVDADND